MGRDPSPSSPKTVGATSRLCRSPSPAPGGRRVPPPEIAPIQLLAGSRGRRTGRAPGRDRDADRRGKTTSPKRGWRACSSTGASLARPRLSPRLRATVTARSPNLWPFLDGDRRHPARRRLGLHARRAQGRREIDPAVHRPHPVVGRSERRVGEGVAGIQTGDQAPERLVLGGQRAPHGRRSIPIRWPACRPRESDASGAGAAPAPPARRAIDRA